MFQPVSIYFKTVANTSNVTAWKSERLSDESIKPPLTSHNIFNSGINYFDNARMRVKCDENYLKQEKVTFTHKQVVNIYIVYETNLQPFTVGLNFTLENFLLVAVKFTTNADPAKYKYSGYDAGFDASERFFVFWR